MRVVVQEAREQVEFHEKLIGYKLCLREFSARHRRVFLSQPSVGRKASELFIFPVLVVPDRTGRAASQLIWTFS